MSYTAITKQLWEARVAKDQEQAEEVKQKYGDLFAETFSYCQGGKVFVMTDPTAIANHYCSL